MQPNEQHGLGEQGPSRKKPDPRDKQAKWLLLVIAILLGLIVSQVAKRFM